MTPASPSRALTLALGAALLLALLWRVDVLALPPHGDHAWRDADGLGVARGFLQESWDLRFPRVAQRGSLTGIVGMELPLVPWLGAACMALLGERDLFARLPVWLSLVPLALGALALGRRVLRDAGAAQVAAAFLVLQPLVVIHSRKLMPEVPMLALLAWGACLAWDGLVAGRWGRALLAGLCFALAATLKPTGVAVGLPVAVWALQGVRAAPAGRRGAAVLRVLLVGLPPLVGAALWFRHARGLEAYGLVMFKLTHDWLEWTHVFFTPAFLSVVFGRVFHLFLLWPTVAWMVWRWRALRDVLREHAVLAGWFALGLCVVVLFGSHNINHPYYALPLSLPTALLVGAFAARAAQRHGPHATRVLLAFLAVVAVTVGVRTGSRLARPVGYDVARLEAALPQLGPPGLAIVTDARTPVVSLVTLHRNGWSAKPEELTPERIEAWRGEGARVLVESSFGGWLPETTRAALPAPTYADDQVRAYVLRAP